MGEVILVLGGVRSGKTRLAERLAAAHPPVTYVATALSVADDPAMTERIARHRASRPTDWATEEIPRHLEGRLPELAGRPGAVVIDCLTLWLTNLILGLGGGPELGDDQALETVERATLAGRGEATVVWVSNEVGSGIVPEDALARRFADLQGWANQRVAERCDSAYLCVAGLPVRLK